MNFMVFVMNDNFSTKIQFKILLVFNELFSLIFHIYSLSSKHEQNSIKIDQSRENDSKKYISKSMNNRKSTQKEDCFYS